MQFGKAVNLAQQTWNATITLAGLGLAVCVVAMAWAGPEIRWGTYLGGSQDDEATCVAVDSEGNVYVAGKTYIDGGGSWVQGGGVGTVTVHHGSMDGFVAKFAPDGAHVWSTYVGGGGWDTIEAIAIESASGTDAVYLVGKTTSSDFLSGGHDTTLKGEFDSFVAKMSTSGGLLWSSCFGGTEDDSPLAIACDPTSDRLLVAGLTYSADWLYGSWDAAYGGYGDGFLIKLSSLNGQIHWGTYLGGSASDKAEALCIAPCGNIYVGGDTSSSGTLAYGWDSSYNGSGDGFVARFSTSGQHWWSSYLGGTGTDFVFALALDDDENLYVAGSTSSSDTSWVFGGWNTESGGSEEAFAALFTSQGVLVRSGLIAGSGPDRAMDMARDTAGNLYLSGMTQSTTLAAGGWDRPYSGGVDAFVAMLKSDLTSLSWCSYFGGDSTEYGNAIAVAPDGSLYLADRTNSSAIVTAGWDLTYGGAGGNFIGDGYLAAISPTTGSLTVTIGPALANIAGAKWRLKGSDEWLDSGATAPTALIGTRTVEFKAIGGWLTPGDVAVTVQRDKAATAAGTYRRNGWLQVIILPAEAVAAGAQWRRKGASTWLDSGDSESVAPVEHAIEFKILTGWGKPADRYVLVQSEQISRIEATYDVQETGNYSGWLLRGR